MKVVAPEIPKLSGQTIAVIAGNGDLPFEIADELNKNTHKFIVISIGDEVSNRIENYPHVKLGWGQLSDLWLTLKKHKSTDLVFAGGFRSRPPISKIVFDWDIIKELPHILAILAAGDNTLIAGVIELIEKKGYRVWGAHQLVPGLLVHSGNNTSKKLSAKIRKSLELGIKVTKTLGELDVGQAAVVVGNRAVAVEGVEGTDEMLRRVKQLREAGRIPVKLGGVLVKSLKPNQELRADMPTIGPKTVELVAEAGLQGIGIEAERTLIIDRSKVLTTAKRLGLFIYGFEGSGVNPDAVTNSVVG